MNFSKLKKTTLALCFIYGIVLNSVGQISISFNAKHEPILFAFQKLSNNIPISLIQKNIDQVSDIQILTLDDLNHKKDRKIPKDIFEKIGPEGYKYEWTNEHKTLLILAKDNVGAAYGLLDLEKHLANQNSIQGIASKIFKPTMAYRIIKFNLPWSPYRNNEATTLHYETCKDLKFWEAYLDMMLENRFNVLSLWNIHPFPYMIKSKNFPMANSYDEAEMQEWRMFWKSLFKMAKQRGIQTFIVNWNIAVSPEFAEAYGSQEYSDLSEQVKKYTKESVTQVINEYPNLSGIGVTLADWMGTFGEESMTPQQREDWIEDTFVEGMKEADRPIKFLHRSVLAGDPMAMRALLDRADLAEPALMEIKFNWSHGHSTPNLAITHDYHSGKLDERFWSPKPENYNIQWMVRNEDFFILRWGQADFIRQHIKTNNHDYVNGYFIGSEGYIPAKDYSQIEPSNRTWTYAFEKQWLFYTTWGQLLYNKDTENSHFENAFQKKYGEKVAKPLFEAYQLVSKMPLKLASFHRSTWDYTLYSEGFIEAAPSSPNGFFDASSPFISIDELIHHETLDPKMISIPDFVNNIYKKEQISDSLTTPLELATEIENDSKEALSLLSPFINGNNFDLDSEVKDAQTWAYLGLYFGDKLRAGVALENFKITKKREFKIRAIALLENCLIHWNQVIALTENRYKPVPHVITERNIEGFDNFSWKGLLSEVEKDIEIAKNYE